VKGKAYGVGIVCAFLLAIASAFYLDEQDKAAGHTTEPTTTENVQKGSPDKPPLAVVAVSGQKVTTRYGSYCWRHKGKGVCADSIHPREIAERIDNPVTVSPGTEAAVSFLREPSSLRLQVWGSGDTPTTVSTDAKGGFRLPDKPGRYVYDVVGYWPEGSGYQVFVINVQ